MAMQMDMKEATKALGKPSKTARKKKMVHIHIEPTDNKGFIVRHTEHTDGMPGQTKHHVFSKAGDMHKHVMKTYPAPKAEVEPEPMEAEAAPQGPPQE